MGGENDPEDQCHVHHVEEGDELRHLVGEVVASHGVEATACYRRFSQLVTKYQEQAQLLDPLLEDLVEPLAGLLLQFAGDFDATDPAVITETSRFLWLLSTVRGYKVVLRFFPNAVAHFEPVVGMLGKLNELEAARVAGTSTAASVWEAQYVLLLWLSMLVLIPFHLSLVDSSLGSAASAAAAASTPPSAAAALTYPPIVGRIMELCRRYLASAGSVREMAAVVMGRLVTRPDMRGALDEWLGWGCQALQQGDSQDGLRGSFLVLGVALTFCTIFKLGKRDALLGPAAQVLPAAVGLLGSPAASGNALTRKLAVKLVQRIGLIFLRPRLAAWRYQKGRSTLLGGRGGPAAGPAAAGKAEQGGVTNGDGGQQVTGDEDAEEDLEHAEQIEGVVEVLLTGLGDRDTVVRWCAAKGVGRLTGRLPRDLAEDVVGSVLGDFFTTGASDTVWHGGCLAVAELARRGLLLPDRLPTVVPLVVHALEYDVRRGPCSVGAHVRDAAAYVLWAFARAYTPEALGDASSHLAPALITLACYDREVNCRRAAAAAFQECVGRLGSFPHGIQVLTAADYFTVSTRSTAYLSVAPTVASHAEYFEPMASHLLTVKLRHWEKALRELTATALAALVPHRPAYFLGTALPLLLPLVTDHVLEVRHGAVAGIAELLPALRSEGVGLPPDLARAVAEILPEMERSKVTRGKGGEVMRSAICRLIETCSRASLPLSPDQQSCLYGHLLDNLRHSSPDIQKAAATALGPFASHYLLQQQPRPQALQQTTLQFLGDLRDGGGSSPLARRGAALALGSLPRGLLEPHGPEVLAALAAATEEAALPPEARDAETRVNAVRALGHVAILLASAAVDGSNPAHPKSAADDAASSRAGNGLLEEFAGVQLSAEGVELLCDQAVEPLLRALEDYTLDNRGDVGSWVREAAMEQLTRLLTLLLSTARQSNSSGQPAAAADQTDQLVQQHDHKTSNVLPVSVRCIAPRVLLALLRQSVERISRVREAAASALQALLPQAAARGVAGADAMASVICPLSLEACVSGEALATVAGLLVHPSTQRVLLEGLAFSAGGLDNQLSTAAGDALAAGVQRLAEEGLQHAQQGQQLGGSEEARRLLPLAEAFVEVWEEAQTVPSRKARLATPLLAAGDVLLSRTPLRGALTTVLDASSATTTAGSAMGGNAPADREAAATEGSVAVHPPEPGAWGVAGRLLTCVRGEVRGCTDIPRLHLAAGLLCQLAELPQPVKAAALASTLGLLGNRYPKVRRYAAEQLYTSLLTFDPDEWGTCAADPDSVPDADAALDLLSSTAWDGPLENVRPARSQLFKCFRLPEPRLLKPGGPTAGQGGPGGDAEQGRQGEDVSYQSLIDRAVRGM